MLILILAVCVFCRCLSVLYLDNIQYALKTSIVSIRGTLPQILRVNNIPNKKRNLWVTAEMSLRYGTK